MERHLNSRDRACQTRSRKNPKRIARHIVTFTIFGKRVAFTWSKNSALRQNRHRGNMDWEFR